MWLQGGSQTSGPGFWDYLDVEAQYFTTIFQEFVVDPKRAQAEMARYRGKRRAEDSMASSLLQGMCQVCVLGVR